MKVVAIEYKHLTKDEHYDIEHRKANLVGISSRQLAREMGRSHTTISRELCRNLDIDFGFYSGIRAETFAVERKKVVNFQTKKMPKISNEVGL